MKLRFIGEYTNERTSITLCGFTFEGREPTECDDPRLIAHPEFEAVEEAPSKPKRGRPRKAD